ncbi:hypothetical protein D3C79_542710 [compost metagenome]
MGSYAKIQHLGAFGSNQCSVNVDITRTLIVRQIDILETEELVIATFDHPVQRAILLGSQVNVFGDEVGGKGGFCGVGVAAFGGKSFADLVGAIILPIAIPIKALQGAFGWISGENQLSVGMGDVCRGADDNVDVSIAKVDA